MYLSTTVLKYGYFHGEDNYTTRESERLLRLSMYVGLESKQVGLLLRVLHNGGI